MIYRMPPRGVGFTLLAVLLSCFLSGCSDLTKSPPESFSYESTPVAITNPDWNLVPLPTNLMNPVQQATIPVSIPGVEPASEAPCCMDLRLIDEEAAEISREFGYPVEIDSALTLDLKQAMNGLDGYIPGFIPDIPFSRPLDLASVVPYDGQNVEAANFFLFDITDPDAPLVIAPDEYFLLFDIEARTSLPYRLTFRKKPQSSLMPEPFEPGHSYLVVISGVNEKGVTDTDGQPFVADTPFLLLAHDTPFIAIDGTSRLSLFSEIEYIREIEMARQVTHYGLSIWEREVADTRTRGEVVSAFNFTIATNPRAAYLNPENVVLSQNPLLPVKAMGLKYNCEDELLAVCNESGVDFTPSFRLSQALDPSTVNTASVALFRVTEEDSLERVEAVEVAVEHTENGARVTITPDEPLAENSEYWVAASDGLADENGRRAVADEYFTLARGINKVLSDGEMQSPYIDSRADTLVALGKAEEPSSEDLEQANDVLLRILSLIETMRRDLQTPISQIVDSGFVQSRESLILAYRFRTTGCPVVEDDSCKVDASEIGDKDLQDADVSGLFLMSTRLENPIAPDKPVELDLLGRLIQEGIILDGGATLFIELLSEDNPGDISAVSEAKAPIDTDGYVTSVIRDVPIPAHYSDLLEGDAVADVTLIGEIINEDGIMGDIVADLKEAPISGLGNISLTLSGSFVAKRQALGGAR